MLSLWSSTVMSFYHTTGSLPYVRTVLYLSKQDHVASIYPCDLSQGISACFCPGSRGGGRFYVGLPSLSSPPLHLL